MFHYPRQEGASSLFSSEMRKDGGNMDERKPKAVIQKNNPRHPEASGTPKDEFEILKLIFAIEIDIELPLCGF